MAENLALDDSCRASLLRLLLIAVSICPLHDAVADARGARLLPTETTLAIEPFEPAQSAALFVGVRDFPYDPSLAEVRYAVDDAVDLAFVLALGEQVRLVDPSRVILALSGQPKKTDSRQKLDRLVASGAQVRSAAGPDVLNALDEQSRAVGKKGVLIFSFATHGFARDGIQYLLSATSILRHGEGAISESEIRDIASQSDAARSLIVIDACRERLTDGRRSSQPDARSAAALLRAMDGVHGQVVLSAAAAGQYAYDDDERRNGVFTAALIDGLRCEAVADSRGLITVDSLSSFVEQHVLTWIRKHRNPQITHATQASFEGSANTMPLAQCGRMTSGDQAHPVGLPHDDHNAMVPANTGAAVLETSSQNIAVIVFDDRGEPNPQLLAAANDAIRESGHRPIALRRSAAQDSGTLRQLAAGRLESLDGLHLSSTCRAIFAGIVARSAATEGDASMQGMTATNLHLRFYLIDRGSGTILHAIDSEARGGGFSKESSEIQAWERAAAILRAEMRKMKWTELLAVQ